MELPDDVLGLIREFSRPFGLRLDWRLGCYINRYNLLDFKTDLAIQRSYMLRQHIQFIQFYL